MNTSVLITGAGSAVAKALAARYTGADVTLWDRTRGPDMCTVSEVDVYDTHIGNYDRVFICHGSLSIRSFLDRSGADLSDAVSANLLSAVRIAEHALARNPNVRVLLMGSESGVKGSSDLTYALSKFALHAYVRERRLKHPGQRLVALAPSMIEDAGMWAGRPSSERDARAFLSPKKRGLRADEVAACAYAILEEPSGFLTNTVVDLNGGWLARMTPR